MAEIVKALPPNFRDILKVFPLAARPGVIFAYGHKIYVPSGQPLAPELLAHELVHCERQLAIGVEKWWTLYLENASFRYEEELLAHRAEYQALMGPGSNRQQRRQALDHVARKLAAPLYRGMVPKAKAKADIAQGMAANG